MAHGTKVNGSSYGITGGKCLVGGAEYSIKKGRTLVNGTGYDIGFLKETNVEITGEGSSLIIYVALNDQKYYDPASLVFDAGQPVTLFCYLESNSYSRIITLYYNGEIVDTGNRKRIQKEYDITGKNISVKLTKSTNIFEIEVTEL